ncbi:imidazole glycerol phosphate synthase subunit HisH [Anoxynatronum buryatiense]|uniref:Imidazole glycerol phosphate synthase subunit HisH n=1 Tax=Anoxynatronum buryatiense TaxID=489973 RepID=A0AA45WX33_9CLOT|nr:imidazole glycerol phosphate synthase subunit HisH [Anoxynatronum buryatiense]SMP56915.1 glutamine amidotransferase [Anoxynatronum buryatiense]
MENTRVAIIDNDMGNMFSVKNALEKVGLAVEITKDRGHIMKADALVLPGVGAFGSAMKHLNEHGLVETIKAFVETGKPFIGICLGLQLLFEESEEFGNSPGLALIKGRVVRFPQHVNQEEIKVPQIAWNKIMKGNMEWERTVLKNITAGEYMYFVHSYYVVPNDEKVILTKTSYEGIEYCSAIQQNNIVAFQFHPEKSGLKGLEIYENIKEWIIRSKEGK